MTDRPKTQRPTYGGASAPAWIGAVIIAAAGAFSSWLSYQSGADLSVDRLTKLEARVVVLEADRDAVLNIENHTHRGRK